VGIFRSLPSHGYLDHKIDDRENDGSNRKDTKQVLQMKHKIKFQKDMHTISQFTGKIDDSLLLTESEELEQLDSELKLQFTMRQMIVIFTYEIVIIPINQINLGGLPKTIPVLSIKGIECWRNLGVSRQRMRIIY